MLALVRMTNHISRLILMFIAGTLLTQAATINANFTSADTIPVTASSYTATGNDVNITLGFAPPTGTRLTIVESTGLALISGRFTNLSHG